MTFAEENYLKNIFHLERISDKDVSTNAIADVLDTRASSVTDMMKKLADKKLLTYRKYKGVQLTKKGRSAAAIIIRKHRLWETFLVEKLNFQWDEVHDIAEQLEHIKSQKLIEQLDAFLNYPKFDPHGDPIPDKEGQFLRKNRESLSNIPSGNRAICVAVKESDAEFLQYLNKKKINIGTSIQLLHKEFDGSVEICIDQTTFFISKYVADNLFVEQMV